MAKKQFSFSQPSPEKKKPAAKLEVLTKEIDPLQALEMNFVSALIEKLKAVYGTDSWKYRLINNAKENYNFSLQYSQVNSFEKGNKNSARIIYLILAEINKFENQTVIKIEKGSVKI